MSKYTLLILAFTCLFSNVGAQQFSSYPDQAVIRNLTAENGAQLSAAQAGTTMERRPGNHKQTQIATRLLSYVYYYINYKNQLLPFDSTAYIYHSKAGPDPSTGNVVPDSELHYTHYGSNYELERIYTNTRDERDRLAIRTDSPFGQGYIPSRKYYTYYPNDKIKSYSYQYKDPNTGLQTKAEERFYYYNVLGKDSLISFGYRDTLFTYDGNGNLIEGLGRYNGVGGKYNKFRQTFTYDEWNKMKSQRYETWIPWQQVWDTISTTYYYYDSEQFLTGYCWHDSFYHSDTMGVTTLSKSPLIQTFTHYSQGGGPNGRSTRVMNNRGLLISAFSESPNGSNWVVTSRGEYQYNIFDKLILRTSKDKDGNTIRLDRYNYEDFTYGAPPEPIPSDIPTPLLFPVPANDRMIISMNFLNPQDYAAAVIDASGRTVMKWADRGAGLYLKAIDTYSLPAGVYNVNIVTEKGISNKTFTIVH